jgi:ATP-binding cassette subfamily C protein
MRAQSDAAYRAASWDNALATWRAAAPILTALAVVATIAAGDAPDLTTGEFLAFAVAAAQFVSGSLMLSTTLPQIVSGMPLYERIEPITRTAPETDQTGVHPGVLRGAIELSHVSFRYRADGPAILHDLSLQIQPGAFVAIVGPSGSGKSTLLRLLLGFERTNAGQIRYDGQDLETLTVRDVRRQIGVVLQHGTLMADDIFHNIIGSSLLTVEDAWAAAQMVGIDAEIRQMPMGMHTLLGEDGNTLSGGQRQRLLIARAIVHKPRILFFDEATSALDNTTQALVTESLARLQATRLVIAHRLSTVLHADQIFVLHQGKIVQSGTYAELMQQDGLFATLARRQIA